MGSLMLQPAVLHLSFKLTWADGSLHPPDLLLDPRTDNWGQGTSTPFVLRLYRRAIRKPCILDVRVRSALGDLCRPFQHLIALGQIEITEHG